LRHTSTTSLPDGRLTRQGLPRPCTSIKTEEGEGKRRKRRERRRRGKEKRKGGKIRVRKKRIKTC